MEAEILRHGKNLPRGIRMRRETCCGVDADVVEIRTACAAAAVGKPKGTYITLDIGQVLHRERDSFSRTANAIATHLKGLLALPPSLPVLVAGLGNREITPDSLGPLTADHIFVTRHMLREMPRQFGRFRPVSAVIPGVLGTSGLETAEAVRAFQQKVEAAAVIAVDAIAARDTQRLCSTVQLSDTGLCPGSGIGNRRSALNEETVGIPVIAVGVPTVTDAATMAAELFRRTGADPDEDALRAVSSGMIVTAGDMDRRVREVSRVLAFGINLALQPELTLDDLTDLIY